MSAAVRFRDAFRRFIPSWLSEKPGKNTSGVNVGISYLHTMIGACDELAEVAIQALQAPWPGLGTRSALPAIGRSRGMIRGQGEADLDYAARLVTWLDRARQIGSMLAIGRAVHEYCTGRPRVRVYNRAGVCVQIAQTTGTVTKYAAGTTAWDWDSSTNPERAGHWWDLWVCVYPDPWAHSRLWGMGKLWGSLDSGIGHQATHAESDAVRSEIAHQKSAHSYVRAVIWTSDASLFDPTSPGTQPDGTWGKWSINGAPSGRERGTCRYWEHL